MVNTPTREVQQHFGVFFLYKHMIMLFTSRASGLCYKNGPVCVSVCSWANAHTAESFNLSSQNLVQQLTLTISWTSLRVKFIGQRSRSPGKKNKFWCCSDLGARISWIWNTSWWHDVMMLCDVRAWHDVTAWRHKYLAREKCSNTLVFFCQKMVKNCSKYLLRYID